MPVIAACFPQFLVRAFRSPPDSGVGWVLAPSGHPSADKLGVQARSCQIPASTRLLRVFRCAAGRCCRAAAARRPSRPRCRHTIGLHRRSGFHGPLAATAGNAQHVALISHKSRCAASGLRSHRREGLELTDSKYSAGRGASGAQRGKIGLRAASSGQLFHLLWVRHAPACGCQVVPFRFRT